MSLKATLLVPGIFIALLLSSGCNSSRLPCPDGATGGTTFLGVGSSGPAIITGHRSKKRVNKHHMLKQKKRPSKNLRRA